MNGLDRERQIKLHMLTSLARSQRALARMIEAMADVCTDSELMAKRMNENIRLITKCQYQLAMKISGISIRRSKRSVPAPPWLCRAELSASRRASKRKR